MVGYFFAGLWTESWAKTIKITPIFDADQTSLFNKAFILYLNLIMSIKSQCQLAAKYAKSFKLISSD